MARRFARLSKPMRRAEAGRAAAFAVMLAAALALGGVRGGCQAVTATDVDGHRLNLPGQDAKAAVLFFVTNDCPITNSSMPEINRLVAAYATRGIGFYAVYTDPTVSVAAIRKHAREYGMHMPLIDDTKHALVHRVGATVTPEAALLERDGKVVYLGRIDDLYVDLGERRAAATQHYLRDALDAVLQGRPVAVAKVEPVGCFIYPN